MPVHERKWQEGDGDDGLRVQDDEGEAQQAGYVGEQQVGAEGQRVVHDRRVAAEPVQQLPCMTKTKDNAMKCSLARHDRFANDELAPRLCTAQVEQATCLQFSCSAPAQHYCIIAPSKVVPDGMASNQAMGAASTAHSILLCSSRAAMSPAVANENARTYAGINPILCSQTCAQSDEIRIEEAVSASMPVGTYQSAGAIDERQNNVYRQKPVHVLENSKAEINTGPRQQMHLRAAHTSVSLAAMCVWSKACMHADLETPSSCNTYSDALPQ